MAVGRDLDSVDQFAKELLHDIGTCLVDDPLDLSANLEYKFGTRKLRHGSKQLGVEVIAVHGEFVTSSGQLPNTRCTNVRRHASSFKCPQIAVECGDGLAELRLGASKFGLKPGLLVGDLGIDLTNSFLEDLESAECMEETGANS